MPQQVYRYERKYHVKHLRFEEIRLMVLTHSAGFMPLFKPRQINNIYLDTPGFDFYYDSIDGTPFRTKYRVRWYGTAYQRIEQAVLEIKTKSGLVNTKFSYPLALPETGIDLKTASWATVLHDSLLPRDLRDTLAGLNPILQNNYYRHYYISLDKKFRITIDTNLRYYPFHLIHPVSRDHGLQEQDIILELKYACEDDQAAREIATYFPFPLTKHSKYVTGMERLLV